MIRFVRSPTPETERIPWLLAGIGILACVAALFGQAEVGTITGKVADSSGGVLPDVRMTASSGTSSASAVTNSSGVYQFTTLPPGTYWLEATLQGFETQAKDVDVTPGHTARQDFVLVLGDLTVHFSPTQCGFQSITFLPAPGSPPPVRLWTTDLCAHLMPFIGPLRLDRSSWRNCGQFTVATATAEGWRQAVTCGTDAVSRHEHFFASVQVPNGDSGSARGLFAGSDAAIFRFTYDGGSCTPAGCQARFLTERCDRPIVAPGSSPDFACAGG